MINPKDIISMATALSLAFCAAGYSQDVEKEAIVKRASGTLIEKLLEAAKLDYTEVKQNVYSFKVRGYKALVFVKPGDIQLYAGFNGKRITLNRVNDWNKAHRFTRAYLDDDGDPILEADLDFDGGVTGETLIRFFAIYAQSIDAFADHLK